MSVILLGVETSCDETSAAVVEDGVIVRSNIIASQVDLHRKFGGVVPEIASRRHLEGINPVLQEALAEAGVTFRDLHGVAVTYGPGLAGALLVGLMAAKTVAFALDIPLIGVNHLEAHIHANFLIEPNLSFPVLCLVVSGGHTDLVFISRLGDYRLLGRTRDDAAGEAFDKVARVLGLGYPGGPQVERLARDGNPEHLFFPRAYLEENTHDFSFSGLKTAVINYLEKSRREGREVNLADVAAGFQQAVVDVLVDKVLAAAEVHRPARILLAGGVAANRTLAKALKERAAAAGFAGTVPPPAFCTDNAAMVACAGYYRYLRGGFSPLTLNAAPGLGMGCG
ncbi:MAG: tRNA (adenosine(37)-N6)-threonylcarbamoyltransferase complex transferase subunit TsaD [Candidatus Desulforudis sp.]|nr:tRNA (adenosine(37)-N6)-threonylcarbamoyltransferase complex transferase subunit TsaD [Desulforudis sp.]